MSGISRREQEEQDYLLGGVNTSYKKPTSPTYTPPAASSGGGRREDGSGEGYKPKPPPVVNIDTNPTNPDYTPPKAPAAASSKGARLEQNLEGYTPKTPLEAAGMALDTTKREFSAANRKIKTFIATAEEIINSGTQENYDWSSYKGGFQGFVNDYEQAKQDLQDNALSLFTYESQLNQNLSVYKAKVAYASSKPSDRELELTGYGKLSTEEIDALTKNALAQDLVKEGILTPIQTRKMVTRENSAKSAESLTTIKEGYQFLGNTESLTDRHKQDLATIGFKLDTPSPSAPKDPTAWDNAVKLAEQGESIFTGVTSKIAEIGGGIAKKGKEFQDSGNTLAALPFYIGAGAMGLGAGAVDVTTFLVRPVAFYRSAEGIADFLHSPSDVIGGMQEQFAINPAYSAGYFLGSLTGTKLTSSLAKSVYNFGAPKVPILRNVYYANKFGKTAQLTEFAARESNLKFYEGAGTAKPTLLGQIKAGVTTFTKGKPNYGFKPFRGTLVNPASKPLAFSDLGGLSPSLTKLGQAKAGASFMLRAKANSALAPFKSALDSVKYRSGLATFSTAEGVNFGGGLKFLRSARANSAYSAFRGVIKNPALAPLTLSEMGLGRIAGYGLGGFYKVRGGLSLYNMGKPNAQFSQFANVNPTRFDFTLGTKDALSSARGNMKFYNTARSRTASLIYNTPREGDIIRSASGRSPNRGFSRIDSGVVGRVTSPYERNMKAFFEKTFREPSPEVGAPKQYSAAALETPTITKTVSRGRGKLPNPYFLSGTRGEEEGVYEEIVYTGLTTPSPLYKTGSKADTILSTLGGIKSKNTTKSTPILKEMVLIKPISRPTGNIKPKSKSTTISIQDPIIKDILRTEPRQKTIVKPKPVIPTPPIPIPKPPKTRRPPPPTKTIKPLIKSKPTKRGKRSDSLEVRLHAVQSSERVKKVLLKI